LIATVVQRATLPNFVHFSTQPMLAF